MVAPLRKIDRVKFDAKCTMKGDAVLNVHSPNNTIDMGKEYTSSRFKDIFA